MIAPEAIYRDFKNIRNVRQQNNNKLVYDSIITNDMKAFNNNINKEQLDRTLKDQNKTLPEFLNKCREDDCFCKLAASLLSKTSCKQGSKDEKEQLKTVNFTSKNCGVNISNLTATELRPTKDGLIVSKSEMKSKEIKKDNCLKSFDGKITGKINGYIAAKVCMGAMQDKRGGGYQDSVFEELDTIAEWWKKYKSDTNEILVILFDTDLQEKYIRLKEKYTDYNNIWVLNHYDLQKYIIATYFESI